MDYVMNLQLFADDEEELVEEEVKAGEEEALEENEEVEVEGNAEDEYNFSQEAIDNLKALYGDDFKGAEEETDEDKGEEKPPQEEVDYKALYEQQQAELEKLKQSYGTPVAQSQPITEVVQNNGTGLRLTPEANKLFNELVKSRTSEISGISMEDIDSMEYLDDGDEQKQLFVNARAIARQEIVNQVRQQTAALQQEQYAQYELQRQTQADIQAFVEEVKATPNYEVVDSYVTNNFLNSLTPMEQMAVKEAYQRANNGVSTPQDNVILRRFWQEGVNDYNARNGRATNSTQRKMQQRNAMPRVTSVNGGNPTMAGEWDADRLEKVLKSGQWDKVPKSVRDRLLRGEF